MRAFSVMALLVVLALPTVASTEMQTLTATHTYILGDHDSKDDARQRCLLEAKRKVLEQAGVYIGSESEMNDFALTKDKITSFAAALMQVKDTKEVVGFQNGHMMLTLTITTMVDMMEVRKNLAAHEVNASVREDLSEQKERLKRLEIHLGLMQKRNQIEQTFGHTPASQKSGISATDMKWLRTQAAQGNPTAQLNLGMVYFLGKGMPQDYSQARQWFEKAASQGVADAQFALGTMYYIGKDLQDDTEAAKWFEQAAIQGHAEAQFTLGNMYAEGHGVPQNYTPAAKWFEQAAIQGHAEAQLRLGVMYLYGRGVPQDDATARRWYEKAALKGNTEAQNRLGRLIDVHLLRTRATQGSAEAQLHLGALYAYGEGVAQDYTQARQWWEKAAAQGSAEAQARIGRLYRDGHGVPRDYAQMWKWFETAAAQGSAEAQVELGGRYLWGNGVPQDYAQSAKWYEKAATQGNVSAQTMLGMLYASGQGVPQDDVRAYMWHHLAVTNSVGFQDELEFRKENRDEVARRMTSAQIIEAQRLSQECQTRQFKGC